MTCLAIDDEELALELLSDNIRRVPWLEPVGAFSDPVEALQFLRERTVDLVFLDIQMPGLTGLQFIRHCPETCLFILVTAYEHHALEGFELNVVDYLVKPVAFDRFLKACQRAEERNRLRTARSPQPPKVSEYIFVNVEYSLVNVRKKDIAWVEGLKDYVRIHLSGGARPVVTRMSMRTLEDELTPPAFIRIHKSHIVALDAVTAIRKGSVLVGDAELPIGDSYREALLRAIGRSD